MMTNSPEIRAANQQSWGVAPGWYGVAPLGLEGGANATSARTGYSAYGWCLTQGVALGWY